MSWTCFHCNETFTEEPAARAHFGPHEGYLPGCIERLPAGRGRSLSGFGRFRVSSSTFATTCRRESPRRVPIRRTCSPTSAGISRFESAALSRMSSMSSTAWKVAPWRPRSARSPWARAMRQPRGVLACKGVSRLLSDSSKRSFFNEQFVASHHPGRPCGAFLTNPLLLARTESAPLGRKRQRQNRAVTPPSSFKP